ncbi:PaaX family transcriptional regulator [Brevibacterium oceani]|uniref:PaaX family transcriptional regulator n=1 Tax=Brevibacterium oceani TaxID=358099 RepID=UPI001B325209|nr:PaaX family transcriptional regulator [Brevibacterium oceani]
MKGVHDVPKRRADVGDRYRMTRITFDVVSAFGCLRARALPGPIIVGILAEHGYSTSSVHNQLVRMVQRGLLESSRVGRVSVYRLGEHLLTGFRDIGGQRETPEYQGLFHSVLYSIPESARTVRDRFRYVADQLGYRQLRPGILIGLADRSSDLVTLLPEIELPGWIEFGELTPADLDAAKRMTSLAFGLEDAGVRLPRLEARMNELSLDGSQPGAGCPELGLAAFFDLYFDVARMVMSQPLLPPTLVDVAQPATRCRELMSRCNLEYYLRFDQQIREIAGSRSSFDLIEWMPED